MKNRIRSTTISAATCLAFSLTAVAAPPRLDYFFPSGAQRGQSVEVTAHGSWDAWPVTGWTDCQGLRMTAGSDKGKLKFAVDPEAVPGVAWIRLTNQEGATSLKPFVIGTLPEVVENEPNDDPAKPQLIDRSTVINGRFGQSEDVDTYAVQLLKGQTLVASLRANCDLKSAVDSVLQICSAGRFVLEQNDDANGLDPLLVFTAPADGQYLIRAFGFPETPTSKISFAGNDGYVYRLTLTTGGFVDHAMPLAVTRGSTTAVEFVGWNIPEAAQRVSISLDERESVVAFHAGVAHEIRLPVVSHASILETPENGREEPQPLAFPVTVSGVIASARDEAVFSLMGKKGEVVTFEVAADELGSLLDAVLVVTDSAGNVLAEADDARRVRDPQLTFTPPADAEYRLTLRDVHGHGGPRYVYRLTAHQLKPDFSLQLTADAFTVKPGASVEVSVTVDRLQTFDREIDLTAVGLPPGVTAALVKSPSTGDASKSVKLVLDASPDAQAGPFHVVGKSSGEMSMERSARLPGAASHITAAWLTVTGGK